MEYKRLLTPSPHGISFVIALLLGVWAPVCHAESTRTDPIGFWPLSEGSGTVIKDLSSPSNSGQAIGAIWSSLEDQTALEFLGSKSFVKISHRPELNLAGNFTIAAWVRPERISGSRVIVSKGRNYFSSGYNFLLQNQSLCLLMRTERQEQFWAKANIPNLKPGEWRHVAATYDTSRNKTRLFADGEPLFEGQTAGPVQYLPADPLFPYPAIPLHIGCLAADQNWSFEGFIKNVRIYAHALSAEEIKGIRENEKSTARCNVESHAEKLARKLTARVIGKIVDEKGNPACCQIILKAADGNGYGPTKLCYTRNNNRYFYCLDGHFDLKVPPGKIQITCLHGPEYFPLEKCLAVESNQTASINLKLDRFVDMPSKGWYGGDHHIHYRTHGQFLADWTPTFLEACGAARAQGLHFASFTEAINDAPLELADFIGKQATPEGRSHGNLGGHVCWINAKTPPKQDAFAFLEAERLKILGIYTHPEGSSQNVANPTEMVMSRDVAPGVLLGYVPIWDVMWGGSEKEWGISTWYRFLNLGFRLAGSGWSDAELNMPADWNMPGAGRVYVKLDQLSWDKIDQAYRHGRTVSTNGPLLILKANGGLPGTILSLGPSTPSIKVEIEAHALGGLQRIELVLNGKTVKVFTPNTQHFNESFDLPVSHTGWIAARCIAKPFPHYGRHAHTSPVYLQFENQPMQPQSADIEFFLKWIDDYRQVIATTKDPRMKSNFPEILEYLAKAEAVCRNLASQPRTWKTQVVMRKISVF
ncbi:MAG: CehA/McbA family metallohydrolase [Verrucomicrobiae bacterium]|nr:CehA/McbA family metallohydrolase [Verrucomicrobiae bacterium]